MERMASIRFCTILFVTVAYAAAGKNANPHLGSFLDGNSSLFVVMFIIAPYTSIL